MTNKKEILKKQIDHQPEKWGFSGVFWFIGVVLGVLASLAVVRFLLFMCGV